MSSSSGSSGGWVWYRYPFCPVCAGATRYCALCLRRYSALPYYGYWGDDYGREEGDRLRRKRRSERRKKREKEAKKIRKRFEHLEKMLDEADRKEKGKSDHEDSSSDSDDERVRVVKLDNLHIHIKRK